MTESYETFPALYHQLIQALHLPPSCNLDEEGRSTIVDGGNVEITVQYLEDLGETVFFSVIDDLENNEHRMDILERMFRANFFWTATKGFTIALEKDGWRVVVMGREHDSYFTDIEHLYAYMVNCAKLVRDWRQLIQEAAWPDLPDSSETFENDDDQTDEDELKRTPFLENGQLESGTNDFRIQP